MAVFWQLKRKASHISIWFEKTGCWSTETDKTKREKLRARW